MWLSGSVWYLAPYTAGICSDQKSWMTRIDVLRMLSYGAAGRGDVEGCCARAKSTPTVATATTNAAPTSSANPLLNIGTLPCRKLSQSAKSERRHRAQGSL